MSLNTEPIPFSRPEFGPAEEEAALRVLRSGWLTTGPECAAFEIEFAAAIADLSGTPGEKPFALTVNSATSGLHLALLGLGIGPGSRVILSPYTFAATLEVVLYTGAEPLLADIAPGTFHLDPDALEQRLERCKREGRPAAAVIVVHFSGTSHAHARIKELCAAYKAAVIEDAAHCFPSTNGSAAHGDDSDVGVFSFYANKNLATGEGGMVITRSEELYRAMKIRRLHGIDRDVWNRYSNPGSPRTYDIVELGYKYNLPDLAAAIGRVQLARAAELHERRCRIAARYERGFAGLSWLELPFKGDGAGGTSAGAGTGADSAAAANDKATHAWHLFVLRLSSSAGSGASAPGLSRDRLAEILRDRGIATSLHFVPLHRMTYYSKLLGLREGQFPVAEAISDSALSIPLFPGMTDLQISRVIEELVQIGDTHYRNNGQNSIDSQNPGR